MCSSQKTIGERELQIFSLAFFPQKLSSMISSKTFQCIYCKKYLQVTTFIVNGSFSFQSTPPPKKYKSQTNKKTLLGTGENSLLIYYYTSKIMKESMKVPPLVCK